MPKLISHLIPISLLSLFCNILPAAAADVVSEYRASHALPGEIPAAVATDSRGFVYLAGSAAPSAASGSRPIFVTRLDPSGETRLYTAYLAGSGLQQVTGLAVDEAGNAYVAGYTSSPDLPASRGWQKSSRGRLDAFVAKLDPKGANWLYTTYLGGSGDDLATGIAVDRHGVAYISGRTTSPDFPFTTAGQPGAFVAAFGPNGDTLRYAAPLGLGADASANAVAVDSSGAAFVAGGSSNQAFLLKLSRDGSQADYVGALGGSGRQAATSLALDSQGMLYLAGWTTSSDFPVTVAGAVIHTHAVFAAKYSANGERVYSTLAAAADREIAPSIAADSLGNAYIAYSAGRSANLLKLSARGERQLASETLADLAGLRGLALAGAGRAVVAGASGTGQSFAARVATCDFRLSDSAAAVRAEGGAGSLHVDAAPECDWQAEASAPWIELRAPRAGSGSLTYTVSPNSGPARSAVITAGGETLIVNQAAAASAPPRGPIRNNPGFRAQSLTSCDDCSSAAVDLGFSIDFYGRAFSQAWVNANGSITFDGPQGAYTPSPLSALSRPTIAPFWADTDTRNASPAAISYGRDLVEGRPAFAVTWSGVNAYSGHLDHSNTFQLLLIDRSDLAPGAFDIEMNYGALQWDSGDAGRAAARAGFTNGTGAPGSWLELPGSGAPGALLDGATDALLGRHTFPVRPTSAAGAPSVSAAGAAPTAGVNPIPLTTGAPTITVGPNLGTWSIGEIQDALTATGGNGAYTWSITAGSLPPGLSLRTDIPSWFPANASAGIIGIATTANAAGASYSFTLQVTSGGQSTSLACTMRITALTAMEIYGFGLPDAYLNQSPQYHYQLTALNNAGTPVFTPQNGLPPGMNLSSSGLFSGTPTAPGNYYVNYTLSDGVDTVNASFSINVSAIQFTSPAAMTNAPVGVAYNFTLSVTGGSPPYTFSTSGLPPGLTLNGAVISGTPTSSWPYQFNVTVTDAEQVSYTKNMTLDVTSRTNVLPWIVNNITWDCTFALECVRGGVNVGGGGTAPYNWTISGLPPGMSYKYGDGNVEYWVGPQQVEFYGAPTQSGTFNVTATVTDANNETATMTYPMTVSTLGVDGSDYLPNGTRGTAYSKLLRVLGGSGSYTVQLAAGTLPDGLGLNGLTVSGTPLENGYYQPIFLFSDTAGATLHELEGFNINAPSSTITLQEYTYGGEGCCFTNNFLGYFTTGNNLNYQLFACCAASLTWSVIGGSLPPGVSISTSGLLTGTPTTKGTYQFLASAAATGNASNYGAVQYTMVITSLGITTGFTLPVGHVGSAYSQTLTSTASATFSLPPYNYLPPGMTLDSTGLLHGTPQQPGLTQFFIKAVDSSNNVSIVQFSLSIYPAGVDPPLSITLSSNLGTFSIGEIQYALTATGGNNTYSWSLISGSLPPGLSLRTDTPGYFPSNASAGLIGIATTPNATAGASYSFTLQVSSGSQTVSQAFTMRITGLTAIENNGFLLPDAFVGQSPLYSYQLTPFNNAGTPSYAIVSGLPPGMNLSGGGLFSGTPTTAGNYNIQYKLSDGTDTVQLSFSIHVYAVQVTSPAILPNVNQGASYNYTLTASGGNPPYTFSVNGLPSGLTLNAGAISGIVSAGPGPYQFNATVTDANQATFTKTMIIDIIGLPAVPPFVQSGGLADCTIGMSCVRNINVWNGGTAPFTWSVTGLPQGMTFRFGDGKVQYWMSAVQAELTGTPTQTGQFSITATVTDANNVSSSQTFPFNVSALGIDGNDYLPNGTRGTAYSKLLRVIGGTGPYSVQMVAGTLPDGVTLNGMTVSGTPLENGSFQPNFVFTDSASNALHVYENFNVSGGASSTITLNQNTFGAEGCCFQDDILGYYQVSSSLNYQLGACCAASYSWSIIGGALPPGINISSSGLLSGTFTTAGTYTFLASAAATGNSANFGALQYTIVVSPLNITTGSLPTGSIGNAYSTSLTASASATFSLPAGNYLPPGLTLDSTGLIHGTPSSAGFTFFFVKAVDSSSNVFYKGFNITIYAGAAPLNLPIGPTIGPYSVGSVTASLSATGGTPPYHYSLTPGFTAPPVSRVQDGQPLPTNFGSATGGILGVWTNSGSFNTSLRVTDNTGTTFDRPLTVNVSPLQVMSLTNLPKGTVNTAYTSYTMKGNGGSGNYSWSATGLPSGMSLSSAGVLSGTPSQSGTFSPSVTLTDTTQQISTGWTFTLIINPFAISNSPVLPVGTSNSTYPTQTLTATNCGSGCTWTIPSGSLPSGLSLSSGGVLSGTPNATYNGNFTLQATGSNGTVQKVFSVVVVLANQTIGINNGPQFSDATFGNQYSQYLSAAGGTPPYTWTVVDPQHLPAGLSLQSPGETLAYNLIPGGTYLWGRPLQLGDFNFTIQVTDSASNSITQAMSLHVAPLNFNYTNLPISGTTLVYNQPYTQQLLVMGGTGNYTSWAVAPGNALPAGLSLNSSTGVISGTPGVTANPFNSAIIVTDSAGNHMTQGINLTIASGTSTTLSFGQSSSLGFIGTGGSPVYNLAISGGTGPYTVTALTPLPPGCALVTGNALLANTSGANDLSCVPSTLGTYTFTLEAQDTAGNLGVQTFTIAYAPTGLFTSTTLPPASIGVAYSQPLLEFDDAGTATWSVAPGSSLPPGFTVSGTTLSGMPVTAGNYTFSLMATDNQTGVSLSYTMSLTVSTIAITTPLTIPTQGVFGAPYSYQFTATGGGSNKTWSASGLPSGLSMSSSGLITGTPNGTGTYSPTVTVTDGSSTLSQLFTLYVRFADPYILNSSPQSAELSDARVGQNYIVTLIPSGGTPPYTWAVAGGSTLPPGLSLISGPVTYPKYPQGYTALGGEPTTAGFYSFDLIATDSVGATVRRTFTLNVSNVSLLLGGLPTATTGTPYSVQLTAVGGTGPYTYTYSPLSITVPMFPPGITASANGLISGTTTSSGSYIFNATATDSAGHSYTTSYTLNSQSSKGLSINNNPLLPFSIGVGASFTLSAGGGTAPYTWSVTSGSLPPGFSLTSAGVLSGQGTTPGTYTANVHAVDSGGNPVDRAYNYTVLPMQLPDLIYDSFIPPATQGTAYSYSYRVAGGTPAYTFSESSLYPLPAGLTLSSTGTISGTSTQTGSYTIYFTLSDSGGYSGIVSGGTLVVVAPGAHNPLYQPSYWTEYTALGASSAVSLDQTMYGGVLPFSWSVASGSNLPAGFAILGGVAGVPTVLAGTPTSIANTTVGLNAADSAGQSNNIPGYTIVVEPIAITPFNAPNGTVGSAYSVQFTPSGGTPPYTFQLFGAPSLPPGLTLSSSGLLSGTPTYPGLFNLALQVTDNNGNTGIRSRMSIVIDNAAGQSPGVSVNPPSIALNYTPGGAAPSPVSIAVNMTSGAIPFKAAIEGIPGASLSATTGTGTTNLNLSLNTSSLSAGTYTGALVVGAPQAVNQFSAVPVILTVGAPATIGCSSVTFNVLAGAPSLSQSCTFSNPNSINFNITAQTTTGNWLSATYNTTSLTVTANPAGLPAGSYSGTVTLTPPSGSAVTLPVSLIVTSPITLGQTSNLNIPAAGTTASIQVTATGPWSVVSSDPTIVINSPAADASSNNCSSGSGAITYTVPANTTQNTFSATLTILSGCPTNNPGAVAVATFAIGQSAQTACNSTSNVFPPNQPTSFSYSSAGTNGAPTVVQLNNACQGLSPQVSWITIANNTPAQSFSFNVAANTGTTQRSGTIQVAGQSITVVQDPPPPCTFSLTTPAGFSSFFSASGGQGSIAIGASASSCQWSATASNTSVIPQILPASGTGSGTLTFNVAANTQTAQQSANILIGGVKYPITQAAAGPQTSYQCSVTAGAPRTLRAEGETELVADLIVSCNGVSAGGVMADLTVTLGSNATITNHALTTDPSHATTDALLLVDNPSTFTLGTNAYRGVTAGPRSIRFPSVPLAPDAGSFNQSFRITNLRVDATRVAAASNHTANPPVVTATISIQPPLAAPASGAPFQFPSTSFTLGQVPATVTGSGTQTVYTIQASSSFAAGSLVSGGPGGSSLWPVTFTEQQAHAYLPALAPGQSPSSPGAQYVAESGFVNAAAFGTETGYSNNGRWTASGASMGTRLMTVLSNLPCTIGLFAPVAPGSGANAQLVSADATGSGGFPVVSTASINGTVVDGYQQVNLTPTPGAATCGANVAWEVTAPLAGSPAALTFNFYVYNPSNLNLSNVSVTGGLAPMVIQSAPSASAPVPRFNSGAPASARISFFFNPTGGTNTGNLNTLGLASRLPAVAAKPASGPRGRLVPETATGGGQCSQTATATVTNEGSVAANGVATVQGSGPLSGCFGPNAQASGSACSCNTSLPPGGVYQCSAVSTSCTPASYSGFATSDQGNDDPNNSDTAQPAAPIVTLTAAQSPSSFTPSDSTGDDTVTVTVMNTGDDAPPGSISITESLPANSGLTLASITTPPASIGDPYSAYWNCSVTSPTSGTCTYGNNASLTPPQQYLLNSSKIPSGHTQFTLVYHTSATANGNVNHTLQLDTNIGGNVYPTPYPETITIKTGTIITITSPATGSALPSGTPGATYSYSNFQASGGSGSYTWTATGLPQGLTMSTAGAISGTPNTTGNYTVNVTASDAKTSGVTPGQATYTLAIAQTQPLAFYPLTPCRVVDTRGGAPLGGTILSAGSTRSFALPGNCNIPATAQAYSLNVTAVPQTVLGYLTIWPTGSSQPVVSTLNSYNGAIVANAAIVPAGTGGAVSVFATDNTQVILDVNGYFAPPGTGGLAFYPLTPCRVADTRSGSGSFGAPALTAGQTRNFPLLQSNCAIPAAAQAYSLNMTVVPPGPMQYLSTWPAGQTQPVVSTLNSYDGRIVANAAIVPAGTSGAIDAYASDATNLLIDINGYFAAPGSPGALYFYPVTPCRVADTRSGSGNFGAPSLAANSTRTFPMPSSSCGLPQTAKAYSLNMTAVPPGSLLYLSTWPAGQTQPVVSTLNDQLGQIVANAAIVPAGASGGISVFVSDATNLIIDVNGYFNQ